MRINNRVVWGIAASLYYIGAIGGQIASPPLSALQSARPDPIVGQAVLKPEKEVVIASQIEAQITRIPFKEGDSFTKGAVLMAFDCRFLEAARERSLAEKNTKKIEYKSSAVLHKLQGISEVDLARAKGAYLQSKAEDSGKALLVEQCIIQAPFSGTVTRLTAKTHQFAKKGEPLVEIIDNKNLRLELIVPSKGLDKFRIGQRFIFSVEDTHKTFPAEITKIVPRIDSITKTLKIIAKVEAPAASLLPGMSGQVFFNRSS